MLPNRFTFTELANGVTFGECPDGKAGRGCSGEVQNWKDISPRVGFAMDVFGNGRTARQGQRRALRRRPAGRRGATGQPGRSAEPHRHASVDQRHRRQRSAARRQRQHSVQRARHFDRDADVRPQRLDDGLRSRSAERLGQARLQPRIHRRRAASARRSRLGQRRLLSAATFGNQTFTDDLRYDAEQLRLVLHQRAGRSAICPTAAAAIRCAASRI